MNHENPNAWREVLGPTMQVIVVFGALGGLVKALAFSLGWKETIRVILVGAGTAGGIGTLSPLILRWLVGDLPDGTNAHLGTLCALAFVIGLIASALIERLISKTEARDD